MDRPRLITSMVWRWVSLWTTVVITRMLLRFTFVTGLLSSSILGLSVSAAVTLSICPWLQSRLVVCALC